jgi:beta-glucosidase
MSKKEKLKFPKNFFWGTSTSAYQIEGGIKNDWSEWERSKKRKEQLRKQGKNPDYFICGRACDSYNRYEDDIDLIKNLNCKAYRMGIEWARIEPREGEFDKKEIEHYRKIIKKLKENNIEPFITLWHYTIPIWFSKKGGWLNKDAPYFYLRYTERIVKELKDDVKYWITENEPETVARNSYFLGTRPPNKKNIFASFKVLSVLVKVHNKAYDLIHKIDKKAKVGCSESLVFFESYNRYPHNILAKNIIEYWRNKKFFPKIMNKSDFIGLQYYFHSRIRINPFKSWRGFQYNENKKTSDMGWEIYPEGLYHILKSLKKYNLPIIITENGLADEEDKHRPEFIKGHLASTARAIKEGVDVRGYFYWSLLDNYEWESGFGPKFGLYSVDKKTFKRIARPSAKVYAEICKNNYLEIRN